MKFILGRKLKMTQIFDKEGKQIPVALIEAGPCFITQIKTKEKDGYCAVQVGFERIEKEKKIKKSQKNKPYRVLKEFRVDDPQQFKLGDKIDVSVFKEGEKVQISGESKGKGFQGGVKRWGFSGRGASHGVKHEERALGSVGSSTPSRVVKGRKMPGRTGKKRVIIKNLEIIAIDPEKNLIAVKGGVPGSRGTLLEIIKKE